MHLLLIPPVLAFRLLQQTLSRQPASIAALPVNETMGQPHKHCCK